MAWGCGMFVFERAWLQFAVMAIIGIVLTAFLFGHQTEIATASLQNSATNIDTFLMAGAGWYQLLFN